MRAVQVYQPWNEQEVRDKAALLRRLEGGEALLERSNLAAHMTASAWVVSPDRSQVLVAYHNLYDSWAATPTESAFTASSTPSWPDKQRCPGEISGTAFVYYIVQILLI